MGQIKAGSVTLEYERVGDPNNPAVILIAGLGFQLIDWPTNFCESLASQGFQVLRFDNRDVGLSEKLDAFGVPDIAAIMAEKAAGEPSSAPYQLPDMAGDVIALMDALKINKAHMVGMSMGGMIAQLLAIQYPDRCMSLTSIMSSSGDPSVSAPDPAAMAVITAAPASQEMADIVTFGLLVNETIGSPGYRWDRGALTAHIEACFTRGYCPAGYMRQMAAVFSAPPRREFLAVLTLPALVIHGLDDLLVPPSAGKDVADHVPGARLELVAGMGHDLSPSLCVHLGDLILPHILAV